MPYPTSFRSSQPLYKEGRYFFAKLVGEDQWYPDQHGEVDVVIDRKGLKTGLRYDAVGGLTPIQNMLETEATNGRISPGRWAVSYYYTNGYKPPHYTHTFYVTVKTKPVVREQTATRETKLKYKSYLSDKLRSLESQSLKIRELLDKWDGVGSLVITSEVSSLHEKIAQAQNELSSFQVAAKVMDDVERETKRLNDVAVTSTVKGADALSWKEKQ